MSLKNNYRSISIIKFCTVIKIFYFDRWLTSTSCECVPIVDGSLSRRSQNG